MPYKDLQKAKEWKEKNKGYYKEWYQKNKKKVKEYSKKWKKENRERYLKNKKEWNKIYNLFHPEKMGQYQKKSREKRMKNSKNRLDHTLGTSICKALKGNKAGRKWETLVGYTLQDLFHHLEKQFDNKMNWQNYGLYWHIDHIVPQSWFPYQTAEEQAFKNCWALENLQPLEAKDNLIKNNRYSS